MTLSILWFILIAVLWTMYLVLEGFDYGVGMLQGFLARDDRERTQALRTIGPHWDGNEVRSIPRMVRNHVLGNVPGTLPHSAGAHRSRLCS